jgi:hypothetical protein
MGGGGSGDLHQTAASRLVAPAWRRRRCPAPPRAPGAVPAVLMGLTLRLCTLHSV